MPDYRDHVLFIENVSKRYRRSDSAVPALTDVSFTAGAGELVALLGVNGAGKSTLVRILSTLLRPDSGTVRIAGHDVIDEPTAVRESIGVAQQDVGLDGSRSVLSVLRLHARLHGLSRDEGTARIDELLDVLRLRGAASRRINSLSGGMRRKVDLALALVHNPPVIFLDEPTLGLDPPSRMELWERIRALRAEGAAILLTTQHLEEADRLADRVIILSDGRVVSEGTPMELKKTVGESILELDFEDATEARRAATQLGDASQLTEGTVSLPISGPEHLRIELEALEAADIQALAVRVDEPGLDQLFMRMSDLAQTPVEPLR